MQMRKSTRCFSALNPKVRAIRRPVVPDDVEQWPSAQSTVTGRGLKTVRLPLSSSTQYPGCIEGGDGGVALRCLSPASIVILAPVCNTAQPLSFPRKRESRNTRGRDLDPRLRGDDTTRMAETDTKVGLSLNFLPGLGRR